jgi:hypothetical protein
VKDGLIDLSVSNIERPTTEEDRRIRVNVAFAHIDSAQRPSPSRLCKRAVGVVLDDTAKEWHDRMLRDDRSASYPPRDGNRA